MAPFLPAMHDLTMTPAQAAWVREHAWPTHLRNINALATAHPELAAKDYGCVCLLGRPCYRCETGRHHECRAVGNKVPETELEGTDGWAVRYSDGRHVFVWLADRTCRAMCRCSCHRVTVQETQQLGLFAAVSV